MRKHWVYNWVWGHPTPSTHPPPVALRDGCSCSLPPFFCTTTITSCATIVVVRCSRVYTELARTGSNRRSLISGAPTQRWLDKGPSGSSLSSAGRHSGADCSPPPDASQANARMVRDPTPVPREQGSRTMRALAWLAPQYTQCILVLGLRAPQHMSLWPPPPSPPTQPEGKERGRDSDGR